LLIPDAFEDLANPSRVGSPDGGTVEEGRPADLFEVFSFLVLQVVVDLINHEKVELGTALEFRSL
jgi:hypothetical protein